MITDSEEFLNQELIVEGEPINITAVNVGNPHAIIFVEDLENVDIDKFGPAIECHEVFQKN